VELEQVCNDSMRKCIAYLSAIPSGDNPMAAGNNRIGKKRKTEATTDEHGFSRIRKGRIVCREFLLM
jgi:hypothetical protein